MQWKVIEQKWKRNTQDGRRNLYFCFYQESNEVGVGLTTDVSPLRFFRLYSKMLFDNYLVFRPHPQCLLLKIGVWTINISIPIINMLLKSLCLPFSEDSFMPCMDFIITMQASTPYYADINYFKFTFTEARMPCFSMHVLYNGENYTWQTLLLYSGDYHMISHPHHWSPHRHRPTMQQYHNFMDELTVTYKTSQMLSFEKKYL